MGFFEPSVWGGGHEGPHHNFVVIAPMSMKFGTLVKLDVFYTMVTKDLLRHYYYVIMTSKPVFSQCIGLNFRCS